MWSIVYQTPYNVDLMLSFYNILYCKLYCLYLSQSMLDVVVYQTPYNVDLILSFYNITAPIILLQALLSILVYTCLWWVWSIVYQTPYNVDLMLSFYNITAPILILQALLSIFVLVYGGCDSYQSPYNVDLMLSFYNITVYPSCYCKLRPHQGERSFVVLPAPPPIWQEN
jgi:hypothetical protein